MNSLTNNHSPRFPLRWQWMVMMGLAISIALSVLTWLILHLEHDAWLNNQQQQASLVVERLGQSLKLPVLTHSEAEVDAAVHGFMLAVPSALTVRVVHNQGDQHFGEDSPMPDIVAVRNTALLLRLGDNQTWFAKRLSYNKTVIGVLAVRFSERAWEDLSNALLLRMLWLAFMVLAFALLATYWVARKMSLPLEGIADAASRVGKGDYECDLTVHGNDEISDAVNQFNFMLKELRHKTHMRKEFGRYLNPNLVSTVFDNPHASVENHRQDVTVLFADMVGFTSFSEGRDPESIIEVLNRHFEVFHCVIDYFGGHVDKYIGDAVMAVFNHSKNDPNHVRHAAMAGLAMAAVCRNLSLFRDDGSPILFRVGMNQGEAIVGNIGAEKRLEYTVIGDTVNLASRMGGIGQGGELAMPISTFNSLGEDFMFQKMGDIQVKGVAAPILCGVVLANDPAVNNEINLAVKLAFDASNQHHEETNQ